MDRNIILLLVMLLAELSFAFVCLVAYLEVQQCQQLVISLCSKPNLLCLWQFQVGGIYGTAHSTRIHEIWSNPQLRPRFGFYNQFSFQALQTRPKGCQGCQKIKNFMPNQILAV